VRLVRASPARRARRRAGALALASGCAALVGGCGVRAHDLFLVQRSGAPPGAQLTLLVDDEGNVHCNGRAAGRVSDPQLIEARAIEEDLRDPASKHLSLPPGPRPVLRYAVREERGSVSFSDDSSGQPRAFRRLALFVLQASQRVCHLPL
jgi:hypothetical protein